MSHDIISDTLNQMMNAKRARKNSVKIRKYSNFLINILNLAKKEGYVSEYKIDKEKKEMEIKFNLNECRAIKPRFTVSVEEIDKYVRRFLPARNFGVIIISTSKGLITQKEALDNKLGGSLIAYFY